MDIFSVAVMSDDFEKSISFAKHLSGGSSKETKGCRDTFILEDRGLVIRAMLPLENNKGHRHNKIYVDTDSPRAVEMALDIFQYKTLPLFLANFQIKIKKPVEFVNFNKEIRRYR